jgi:hypothetical protein
MRRYGTISMGGALLERRSVLSHRGRPKSLARELGCPSKLFVALVLAWPGLAHAADKNPVVAQALYDEARQLVAAEKFEQACPKFKASYELDPAGGTLLNLADCYERQGKTALAWTTFKDALEAARRDGKNERIEFATQHLATLEKRLSRLSVAVPDTARLPGLEVTVDGTPLAEAAYGMALPVDPGTHRIRAVAPGKQAFEKSVEVPSSKAERLTIDLPTLADASGAPPDAPEHIERSSAPGPTTVNGPSTHTSTARTLGFVASGLGLISVGVGGYFGLKAFSRWDARNEACQRGCTAEAKTAGDEAKSAATVSTVGFATGAAALGVGLVLILTSPAKEPEASAARVGKLRVGVLTSRDGAGLSLESKW